MFSLMGNCISCVKKRREPKQPITLAVLGLDCAGKTTTTKSLVGESLDEGEAPTIGFTSFKLDFGKFEVTIFDLGGGRKIRGIWRNYLAEVHGVIYVVDSTAANRMEEAKETLTSIIEHPRITGKPILLLANKQDKPEALDEVDICEQLNLEALVNVHKCPTRMETVSALKGSGRKMDVNLKDGLEWLVSIIERDLEQLQARVKRDVDTEKEKQKAEREARKERVRLQREKRDRQEAENRKRLGLPEKDDEDEMIGDSNPFKALDIKELEAKDRKLKEEKKLRKELEQKAEEEEVEHNHGDYDGCALDSIRSDKHKNNLPGDATHTNNSSKYSETLNRGGSLSGNGAKFRLPPLISLTGEVQEERKKKKKKKRRPNLEEFEDDGELLSTSVGNKSLSSLSRVQLDGTVLAGQGQSGGQDNLGLDVRRRVEPTPSLDTPRAMPMPGLRSQRNKSPHISSLEEMEEPEPSPRTLTGTSMEEESHEEESTGDMPTSGRRKKKKRRLKKNRLAPSDGLVEMSPIREVKSGNSAMPWDQNQNNYKKVLRRNEPTGSKQIVGMGSQTWSVVSDLPDVEEEPRLRPNYDDDDDIVM